MLDSVLDSVLDSFMSFPPPVLQVGALSCSFIRGHARERDECMISLCTFGKLVFAGRNNRRRAAVTFKSFLDHTCLQAILSRFNHFNDHGGAFVRMNGELVHFERACLVGIFADLPAAMKLTLTGSSCNTCFLPQSRMAEPFATADLRTWANMTAAKRSFLARIESGEAKTTVLDEAKRIGVNYLVTSAFAISRSGINPIGPNPDLDHPWGCCPPVFLHGMEAGTLMKTAETTLNYVIARAAAVGINATSACRHVDAFCALVSTANPRNSNIELGHMALLPQPHGITAHLLSGKSLDGNARSSVARLMHMYVATSDLFNDHQRSSHCKMYDMVWECRELMSRPLHRCNLEEVQDKMNLMDRTLVSYMGPFHTPGPRGGCKSEKHHQWAHYSLHRKNTGCTAKEYAFERSYAVGHKKQVQFTNKSKTKALQTSAKHWFRNGVHRLAIHLAIHAPPEVDVPTIRTDELYNAREAHAFQWPSRDFKALMLSKARSMDPPLILTRSSTTLHVTLKNRMKLPGKPGRLEQVILRAVFTKKRPWVDNIRVQYRDNENAPAVGFAKCLGFFGDAMNNNYVAIQWYQICGRLPVQRVSRMTKVQLMESYQFVPVGSILNGALVVPLATPPALGFPQQWWVLQTHREAESLSNMNA